MCTNVGSEVLTIAQYKVKVMMGLDIRLDGFNQSAVS